MAKSINTYGAWQLMKEGRLEEALEALPTPDHAPSLSNRGLCLLLMNRFHEALEVFQRAQALQPKTDGYCQDVGVVLWRLGRSSDAIDMWRQGLKATYRDAAGGVETPAILFFAASRLKDPSLEKEARRWLKTRWKPALATLWPGPIAGFLLDEMDEDTFLVNQTFLNHILEARRLCKAHFWVGLKRYRQSDVPGYLDHLRQAIADASGEHFAVILETEYWLARVELELHQQDPGGGD
jgi:tetratricopeptide (TPR) repeat protein